MVWTVSSREPLNYANGADSGNYAAVFCSPRLLIECDGGVQRNHVP
jgi:hypothetical protein